MGTASRTWLLPTTSQTSSRFVWDNVLPCRPRHQHQLRRRQPGRRGTRSHMTATGTQGALRLWIRTTHTMQVRWLACLGRAVWSRQATYSQAGIRWPTAVERGTRRRRHLLSMRILLFTQSGLSHRVRRPRLIHHSTATGR